MKLYLSLWLCAITVTVRADAPVPPANPVLVTTEIDEITTSTGKLQIVVTASLTTNQVTTTIQIKNVAIEDLRSAPYRARIEFYKIVTSPIDHSELKRELWTANIVYVFRDQVPNDMLLVNPLGLTITYFREDQAFEK